LPLSRFLRKPAESSSPSDVPARRALLWAIVGAAVVVGLVLYFMYARLLEPLIA
jgi:type VI protein secretion system component VasF